MPNAKVARDVIAIGQTGGGKKLPTAPSAEMVAEKYRGQKRQRSRGPLSVADEPRPLQNARKQAAATQLAQQQQTQRQAEEAEKNAKQLRLVKQLEEEKAKEEEKATERLRWAKAMRFLLEERADVGKRDGPSGKTCMDIAASKGESDTDLLPCGKEIQAMLARASASETNGARGVHDGQTPARAQAVVTQLAHQKADEEEKAKQVLRNLQAIVISLVRRPDRMDGCAQRLRLYSPGLSFERFEATDGRQTEIPASEVVHSWHTGSNVVYQRKRAIRKGWNDLDTYQERHLVLSPGERGCASSHIRAWRRCLEQSGGSERPLLVLEDDAAPTPHFATMLARALAALPQDAHLLYLGYSQAADWRREVSPELVESEYVWTTVGYIIWPAGARILLDRLPVDGPVDNWMAGLAAARELKAYCVRPKIVRQAEAWNVNSDVSHSDEHYWGPNSDIHHSDALYWGRPEGSHLLPEEPCASGSLVGSGSGCHGIGDGALAESEQLPPPRPFASGSCFWDIGSADSEDSSTDDM
jgi:GR25 family glycosyltransferase involved in LPS biosynthesis